MYIISHEPGRIIFAIEVIKKSRHSFLTFKSNIFFSKVQLVWKLNRKWQEVKKTQHRVRKVNKRPLMSIIFIILYSLKRVLLGPHAGCRLRSNSIKFQRCGPSHKRLAGNSQQQARSYMSYVKFQSNFTFKFFLYFLRLSKFPNQFMARMESTTVFRIVFIYDPAHLLKQLDLTNELNMW